MSNEVRAIQPGAVTVYGSTARLATPDTVEYHVNRNRRAGYDDNGGTGYGGVVFIFDLTACAGGAAKGVTFKVEGIDPASGKAYLVLSGVKVSAAATTVYKVGLGLTAAANSVANDVMPSWFRITMTHDADTTSATYSVGAHVMG